MGRVRSPKRRVRDDDFIFGLSSDYLRTMLGSWPNRLYIGGSNSGIFRWHLELRISWQAQYLVKLEDDSCCSAHCKWRFISDWCGSIMRFILRGRRSFWWSWRMIPVAPRIVNDVSSVMRINHEIHFAWQAQYLVKLDCDSCCSAHCKWRFMWDAGQSWFILRGRRSIWWSWIVTPVVPQIVNDVSYVTRINHEIQFARKAQYLVKLDCDSCCSAHCKWRFICDAVVQCSTL